MQNNLKKLSEHIDKLLLDKERVIIAIDGKCGSGKTTLSRAFSKHFSCPVIHTDDFFLRPIQRTEKRLLEIGGNIDYERFKEEVITPIGKGIDFYYRPYDCKKQELCDAVYVKAEKLIIIDGAYSMHPYFGKYYDFSVFMTAEEAIVSERLRKRNEKLFPRFINEWIPMENRYYDAFSIREKADMVIDATKSSAI